MPDEHPPEYVLYLRKSRGRAGIPRQRNITTAYIRGEGGTVAAEFTDTDRTAFRKIGAPRPDREDFAAMLAWLPAHPGTRVAACYADRLLRDPGDTEDLIRVCVSGGHLIETPGGGSYDLSTANGRKRLRQDALDATYEVDHMTERITAAKTEAAANGEWRGGRRPFGYEKDGVTLRPAEAALLAAAIRTVIGGGSLGAIARQWAAIGVLSPAGMPFTPRQLGRTMRRARNAALIERYGETVGPALWQPVVSEREWRAVRAVLEDPARRTSPGNGRRWLLSGIARCGVCGGTVTGSTTGSRRGSRAVYRCREKGLHVGRACGATDEWVTANVIAYLRRPDVAQAIAAATPGPDTAFTRGEMAAIDGELLDLAALAGKRKITATQMAAASGPLLEEKQRLEAQLTAMSRPSLLSPFGGRDPGEVWGGMPLEARRAVVAGLVDVTILPAPKGRPAGWRAGMPYFDPESVKVEPRWEASGDGGES